MMQSTPVQASAYQALRAALRAGVDHGGERITAERAYTAWQVRLRLTTARLRGAAKMRLLRKAHTTSVVNPLAHFSNHELVAEHCKSGANSHFLSEMIRRLMESAERLTLWLLWFTIAIFLLTAVQAWVAWKTFTAAATLPPPL